MMNIAIDKQSPIPVYQQIYNQIREMVLTGVLPPGFQLPPERKLALRLGVNRSTVLNAYRELKADAFIDSHIGRGTVVISQAAKEPDREPQEVNPLPWRQFLSEGAARMQQPLVSEILKNANRKDVISFAAGFSAYHDDPIDELLATQKRLLADYGGMALQYSASEGHYPLRESLCQWMEARGIQAAPEEVAVLAGSQQGIDLTARIILDPGDIVVVEEPTFFSALQIFQSAGARIIGVPIDRNGMRVDMLESLLERLKPKLIYTIPTFQNPSGAVMDMQRRQQLLNLAYRYRVPILEDDPYGELRYEGSRLPSLKALDRYDHVIYLSSFSKIMFPGLRVGWVTAAQPLVRQYVLAKQMADLHTNSLAQWLMDDFLRRGLMQKQAERVKVANHRSRDVMAEALAQSAGANLEWEIPEGGLYFWCRLPEGINQHMLVAKASEKKVVFVPGHIFYPGNSGPNYIRLSFGSADPELIKPGIRALMAAVAELLDQMPPSGPVAEMEIKPIL